MLAGLLTTVVASNLLDAFQSVAQPLLRGQQTLTAAAAAAFGSETEMSVVAAMVAEAGVVIERSAAVVAVAVVVAVLGILVPCDLTISYAVFHKCAG